MEGMGTRIPSCARNAQVHAVSAQRKMPAAAFWNRCPRRFCRTRARCYFLRPFPHQTMDPQMRIARWPLLFFSLILYACSPVAPRDEPPQNVILFISDGCGPASFTMARGYLQDVVGRPSLALDSILVGSIDTRSSDSRVTDSAAGATAFACGVKTNNGAIAVDPSGRPLTTILEAAEARGMATGLVVTSKIAHATPAAFSAHVKNRDRMDEIASQQIGEGIEVLFGGGIDQYLPEDGGGARTDGRNLFDEAGESGYQIVTSRSGFDAELRTPVLALFTPGHMSYEIDRDPSVEPSLAEMTQKAIDLLSSKGDGFFLMVEGSRIDHAAHENDAAAHLHDILAFDDAVAGALAFAAGDGHTLVVSTSDHETGGLSLGRNIDGKGIYAWEPRALAKVRHSEDVVEAQLLAGGEVGEVVSDEFGIDPKDLTSAELKAERSAVKRKDASALHDAVHEMIDRRAIVAWTTHGHTAVDINVYAYGPGASRFKAHNDNTYIGQTIAALLGLRIGADRPGE